MKKKNERNAGRKLKYGEATEILTVKVPMSKKEEIRKKIKELLKKYEPGAGKK